MRLLQCKELFFIIIFHLETCSFSWYVPDIKIENTRQKIIVKKKNRKHILFMKTWRFDYVQLGVRIMEKKYKKYH